MNAFCILLSRSSFGTHTHAHVLLYFFLDAQTGRTLSEFTVPRRAGGKALRWGNIGVEGNILFGTDAVPLARDIFLFLWHSTNLTIPFHFSLSLTLFHTNMQKQHTHTLSLVLSLSLSLSLSLHKATVVVCACSTQTCR